MLDAAGDLTVAGAVWFFLAHRVGDWILQNGWMASEKTHRLWVALLHGFTYAVPFIPLCSSVGAYLVIAVTHAVIDRYRLPRYVTWARNQLAPRRHRHRFSHRHEGSSPELPDWLAVHIRMETDVAMHHVCNFVAVMVL